MMRGLGHRQASDELLGTIRHAYDHAARRRRTLLAVASPPMINNADSSLQLAQPF